VRALVVFERLFHVAPIDDPLFELMLVFGWNCSRFGFSVAFIGDFLVYQYIVCLIVHDCIGNLQFQKAYCIFVIYFVFNDPGKLTHCVY
jgi:hypothetical protein